MKNVVNGQIFRQSVACLPAGDKDEFLSALLDKALSSKFLLELLISNLDKGSLDLRRFAARCLGTSNSRRAYKALLVTLKDNTNDASLRCDCFYSLGFLSSVGSSHDVISVLKTSVKASEEASILVAGANALGYYKDRGSEKYLGTILRNVSLPSVVRASAAESLGLHSKRSVSLLMEMLDDPDVAVRFFATRSLGWIGSKRAITRLKKLAKFDKAILDWPPDGGAVAHEATEAINSILRA